jgi:addiction module HigA family antidote
MIKASKPPHPGLVLVEVYMKEMGLTQTTLAELCGCNYREINQIVNQKKAISPEFAIKLEKALGTTAEMWVRMQAEYNLGVARSKFT